MFLSESAEKQAIARLQLDNPWWEKGSIRADFKAMGPRAYLEIFYGLVQNTHIRRSIILMGPRRVGKTVMIYHTIQKLIESGTPAKNIIYVSVDTPIYNGILLEELMAAAFTASGKAYAPTEQYFVFFDEVQYLKQWELNLKSMADAYPNIRFVASGSAAAALKKSSIESGAGRFTDFSLPPLTFYEYVHLRHVENLLRESTLQWNGHEVHSFEPVDIAQLNNIFVEYINYGGYPEVAFNTELQADPGQYIRHDIIDKVLLRDLPSLYGITDVQELNSLFAMIAFNSGGEFSYESLAQNTGVKKETLRKYIEYFEAAFLLKKIHRTDDTAKRYQREHAFKLYLTNPSLRCALFLPITLEDKEIGTMVETAVFAQWIPRLGANIGYASWRVGRQAMGEVDIVGISEARQKPDWAVELKWTDRYYENPGELSSLRSFMETNGLTQALVTTQTQSGLMSLSWGNLQFMPTACYAYIVGRNTLFRTKAGMGL
jgi:hypothetical protein